MSTYYRSAVSRFNDVGFWDSSKDVTNALRPTHMRNSKGNKLRLRFFFFFWEKENCTKRIPILEQRILIDTRGRSLLLYYYFITVGIMFLKSSDKKRSKFNRAKSMLYVLVQFFCQICISRYVYRKKRKIPLLFQLRRIPLNFFE